ncbi:MAG: lipopolysaccharide core heptose(I) kinase RfaP [Desulfobacterales bacterium]|nr:lipopolysaccharide core heptose(I) kinase RfaP [Desulfobacterales bacterium]
MILKLPEAWRQGWGGQDPFEAIMGLKGEVFKSRQGRTTLRFTRQGRHYFAKLHRGVGWGLLLRYLGQLRWPVTDAGNEWRAIGDLETAGVPTMKRVAYGRRGWSPARRRSFLITEALEDTINLEDYCKSWGRQPPPPARKRALIAAVARIARRLHGNGFNHRDFYLCHLLLRQNAGGRPPNGKAPQLYLIDLHRVRRRRRLPRRWRIKDIAGIYFSSFRAGLTRTDRCRFIQLYTGKPLREALQDDPAFWRRVAHKRDKDWRTFARHHPDLV